MPATLDTQRRSQVHALWDELAGYEASQSEAALLHLLGSVARMVDAQNAYWVGAVKLPVPDGDPLRGWRPRVIRYLSPPPEDPSFTKERMRAADRGAVDELWLAHAQRAGSYRAYRFVDV